MKLKQHIPICANALFIYKLDLKKDLTLKFKKEEFKPLHKGVFFTGKKEHDSKKPLDILNHKTYKELTKEIKKALDFTIKDILMLENIDYEIYSSWLTKTEPNAYSQSHNHSNAWISGIYYPKYDPGFTIKFFNDNISQFFSIPKSYNIYNCRDWTITPEDNDLILFFSQLRHKIMRNESTNDRYSLAFNTIPKGPFGEGDSFLNF
jgi:uncharacterized protein (TIGR02466 family)|tara:strand:+ start:369 stop:986 length:618 start_codon:yes stop_codon:yes gene_type:complete